MIDVDTTTNRLTGVLVEMLNSYFGPWMDANTTYILEKESGLLTNATTGTYNGCIGLLQSNETDLAMVHAIYPTLARGTRQGTILSLDTFSFSAMYNKTTSVRENDVVDAFSVFSKEAFGGFMAILWGLVIILSITLKLLEHEDSTKRNKLQRASEVVFENSVQQFASYEDVPDRMAINVLILVLTVLTFYVYNFISSFLRTDLVTVSDPILISGVDELLKRPEIEVIIMELEGEKNYFDSFPEGSREKKLSRRLQTINPGEAAAQGGNMDETGRLLEKMRKGTMVLVHKLFQEKAQSKVLCKFLADTPELRKMNGGKGAGRYGRSVSGEFLTAYLASEWLSDGLVRKIDSRIRRVLESGVLEGVFPVINDFFNNVMPGQAPEEPLQECMRKQIVLETPEVKSNGFKYYQKTMWLLGLGFLISLWSLVIETIFNLTKGSMAYKARSNFGSSPMENSV